MLKTSQQGVPAYLARATPATVEPGGRPRCSRLSMLSAARRTILVISAPLSHSPAQDSWNLRRTSPEARSPPSWPPIPSATRKTGGTARQASSLSGRTSPG